MKGTEMPTLGIIGSGNIGSAIARLAVAAGMNVVIANSRGVDSLQGLVAELGPLAKAGTVEEAASLGDAVVLSIPLAAVEDLPAGLLQGKIVLDTSNYYPSRDGRIAELDNGSKTTSELVQELLGGARYVKAFGNILAHHIPLLARPSGAPDRTTLPIASDDARLKAEAAALIDLLGFDTLDAGTLADSWKFEPESAGYTRIYLADQSTPDQELMSSVPAPTPADRVKAALDSATRVNVAERAF
ncbi:NADPH-dependent F420 reductase [Arthrobacter sp. zg-Y820]|uniref:NADPH-dependent F420 reductase n=1 Tax=Arthrobacter sp. zg-Y820 TaxID=2894192 RepID=UPI0022B1E977|nr:MULTISPECIES: NADPH-dependent F420 reductase [unclassified Arthrobacter]MDK1278499.1 NADPH-dependent F420 reductase [Arthrobacter sp. zg.Y820]WIB09065.1 NADPH-dependent F420 reductase [Arthrobacter sp. zg-Y820]